MFMKFLPAILLITAAFSGLASAQDGPDSVMRGTKEFRKRVVVSGLAAPWELTWGPDDKLWVTERTGKRVTRIDPISGERRVAVTIDEVSAPGGQEGLLGMALHPALLKGSNYVFVAYTYVDESRGPHPAITDPKSPYRYLYGKIVRLTYNKAQGTLSDPVNVIAGLPAGNDHVAGRLKFGPDQKLYFTIGDQGHNQLGNFCLAVEAQRLPTQTEIKNKDYVAYVGKSLRLNLDGSVPADNPRLNGVVSHVFTYGHRNPQGLDFGPDGTLYSSEQGPKTDDEVNILKAGSNYGWPHVVGMKDNKAYEYARWADASRPCSELQFSDLAIDPTVPREPESAFKQPMVEPIATMFTVPSDYNFHNSVCGGFDFICWATVAASSIEYYPSSGKGIPGWERVLLVTTLKRGSLYVLPLTSNGKAAAGHFSRYFQSENRMRDTAVSRDGKTIYIATDPGGLVEGLHGGAATRMENPGAILAYTYAGEGTGTEPRQVTETNQPDSKEQTRASAKVAVGGMLPQFTAAQAVAGKAAYNSNCAVCHGSTMTNGTFGPPLAGQYFKKAWSGQSVRAFYERARKTMPPAAPASLPRESYAAVVAYILEFNGFKAGNSQLPSDGDSLGKMTIQ
jgi:PQQ-dependent dehydrogenase (s-GDH family)